MENLWLEWAVITWSRPVCSGERFVNLLAETGRKENWRLKESGLSRARALKKMGMALEVLAGDASTPRGAGPVVYILQEVLVGGSPPFPAQNSISEAYWEPGIRPTSHTAILSMSGEKQRSRVP